MKNYKLKLILAISVAYLAGLTFSYASDHGHDHKYEYKEESHAGHSHDNHDHEDHEDHDDQKKQAGPNGGRIVTEVEPHLEFFVTKEGKVQISFLSDAGTVIPPANQKVSLIGGDRSSPTQLKFEKKGNILLSDRALPSKNNLPIVLQVKVTPESKTIREKFNLNLSECPTCEHKEYACICEHGGNEHNHNH